jgi:ribosomal protein S18 acetylase RimI-like enzyme
VIQDPADELLAVVRRAGDDPSPADRAALALVRRRFGLSLPLPFAPPLGDGGPVPIRAAVVEDGPAIAATKWRSWRLAYRGILPPEFLDRLAVHPTAGFWAGRAAVPPSNRHALLVAGPKGTVAGLVAVEPWRVDRDERRALPSLDPATTSELKVAYVDPLVQRRGIGRALVDAAIQHARTTGASDLRLWVAEANAGARAFYEALRWEADGERQRFELEPGVAMDEVRYRFTGALAP